MFSDVVAEPSSILRNENENDLHEFNLSRGIFSWLLPPSTSVFLIPEIFWQKPLTTEYMVAEPAYSAIAGVRIWFTTTT